MKWYDDTASSGCVVFSPLTSEYNIIPSDARLKCKDIQTQDINVPKGL